MRLIVKKLQQLKSFLTINRRRWVTLVPLDTSSTKHDHRWIWTLWTCLRVYGIGAADIEVPSFNTLSITLNWLVILLSSLNSTTYCMFSSLT